MAATKKYFWLKLKDDFFRDKKIKKLRRIAGGDTFTIIYLKMQLLSLKNAGKLIFEGVEDDFIEEIALEIDEDVDNVKVTVAFLMSNNLIEEVATDEYILPQTVECIGSEGSSASRMRKHREKKKTLEGKKTEVLPAPEGKVSQSDAPVTKSDTEIEKEKEIEIEKETDKQTDIELTPRDLDHIGLIHDLFASWPVNNFQLIHIYDMARKQIPFEIGKTIEEYDIQVYDGLQNLTMKAKADGVTYIYKWMEKLIPLTEF